MDMKYLFSAIWSIYQISGKHLGFIYLQFRPLGFSRFVDAIINT